MGSAFKHFVVSPHNKHYEGQYAEKMLAWRRLGALEKASNIQTVIGGRKFNSVLEVGCGTGAVLAELAKRGVGKDYEGVDVADPDVHRDASAQDLKLSSYDGTTLPYADKSFDFVFASHVIEHVPEPRRLISEMSRVAKDLIYFEVPCELHFRTTHDALQRTLNIGHINSYTPESFLLLMQTSGLQVVDFQVFDHDFEVHSFHSSKMKAYAKMALRRSLLALSPHMASKLFTYHCGALVTPAGA